ncbi:hypothetical protein DICVIV_13784 [Dictyocaulus viviparus]|uniref:Uncharacterized protein n=1 Tax=Dictyocaulus viviparus TaxID=29172 RepID=A0A0D8X9H1_DICVI|nr:hypothetical protein DICVIV_13784 [Dictyocaulus viviparus]
MLACVFQESLAFLKMYGEKWTGFVVIQVSALTIIEDIRNPIADECFADEFFCFVLVETRLEVQTEECSLYTSQ